MSVSDDEIRERLQLGEDDGWEFRQIQFQGNETISPQRDDLADELVAFANANGGKLLCGVTDDGQIQGITPSEMAILNRLLVDVSADLIKPALYLDIQHRQLDAEGFVLVEIPRSDTVHERSGRAFVRVGASKRPLDVDERLQLAERRAQNRYRYRRFDQQIVPDTGFNTLDERLWEPLLSMSGAENLQHGLMNLRLLAADDSGIIRVTNAGALLCAASPQHWLPQAKISATHYRGKDRTSEQLDAQEIVGTLPDQISEAVKFVVRNMRVAARKTPARENMPQYSATAIFEALVNAVAHRDYSVAARRIRLSMFKDRLEIESPGQLPYGMTIENMNVSQATRNEAIASVLGRIPVSDVPGSTHRRYLMERRGDGVSLIVKETWETSGKKPEYKVVDDACLVLSIPAAELNLTPSNAAVAVHSGGAPLAGVDLLVLFPNKTWQQTKSDDIGEGRFKLYTTNLAMTVYAAAPGYAAKVEYDWKPDQGNLQLDLVPLQSGGSAIFSDSDGQLPGLHGRLNPIRDTSDRTYLYANNISINDGRQQPVVFRRNKPIRLTDSFGVELAVTIVEIIGESVLLEYQPYKM